MADCVLHIRTLSVILLAIGFCFYHYSIANAAYLIAIIQLSDKLIYEIVTMSDRKPVYKLATIYDHQSHVNEHRVLASVINYLKLNEKCRDDPSLIVVDVGGFVVLHVTDAVLFLGAGDLGTFAAACGCQVYLFETQLNMIHLINISIRLNEFSSERIHVFQHTVNDLSNSSKLFFNIVDEQKRKKSNPYWSSRLRLDDVQWPNQSRIYLLKIDVEGYELNVLRSTSKLFEQGRIDHLIMKYGEQKVNDIATKNTLRYLLNSLQAEQFYAFDRTNYRNYGPIHRQLIDHFNRIHLERRLNTYIYASRFKINSTSIFTENNDTLFLFS